jgi:hypothetical protein
MDDDKRREAIAAPVAMGSAQIEEPLVNRLLNDVGDDPAKLPLLQHALMRTWGKWEQVDKDGGKPLGISHYEAVGELEGALSAHANEVYGDLSVAQQLVAEKVFKALTAKSPDGRGIRTPRKFGDLCAIVASNESSVTVEPDVTAVIEAYRGEGRSFLMPPPIVPLVPDTLIDISHESLIQGWDRLQEMTHIPPAPINDWSSKLCCLIRVKRNW